MDFLRISVLLQTAGQCDITQVRVLLCPFFNSTHDSTYKNNFGLGSMASSVIRITKLTGAPLEIQNYSQPRSTVKSKFFSEGIFSYRGFSLLKSEHQLFLHFPELFSKYFLLKLKLFRHNPYYNKNLLRIFPLELAKKWVFTFTKISFLK